MPIRNCRISSFTGVPGLISLPISITNPANKKSIKINGIIDTGASECFVPAKLSVLLGFDYLKVRPSNVSTGNGQCVSYKHNMNITIYHPEDPDKEIFRTLQNVVINFMPSVPVLLLGVNGFLSEFALQIDYKNGVYSLISSI
jgi:hypothetical protein